MAEIYLVLGGIVCLVLFLFLGAVLAHGSDESNAPIREVSPKINGLVLAVLASMLYLATNET